MLISTDFRRGQSGQLTGTAGGRRFEGRAVTVERIFSDDAAAVLVRPLEGDPFWVWLERVERWEPSGVGPEVGAL